MTQSQIDVPACVSDTIQQLNLLVGYLNDKPEYIIPQSIYSEFRKLCGNVGAKQTERVEKELQNLRQRVIQLLEDKCRLQGQQTVLESKVEEAEAALDDLKQRYTVYDSDLTSTKIDLEQARGEVKDRDAALLILRGNLSNEQKSRLDLLQKRRAARRAEEEAEKDERERLFAQVGGL